MLRATSTRLSFCGNHTYDRLIPNNHFLRMLDKAVDFSFVNDPCRDAYAPNCDRLTHEPKMTFKILFLYFFYIVSDHRVEEEVNLQLVFK